VPASSRCIEEVSAMNPMPELIPLLKQLRLSGILDSIEARNRQAIEEKFSYMDFLATIIQDEIARRSQKRLASAIRRANFRNQKTLEEFDFTFNASINRALILELASCRFMDEKVSVIVVGPCGTGKTLSQYLQRQWDISLGVRQCQRLFRQLGFRLRKPRPKMAHADPALQAAYKKTARPGPGRHGGSLGSR